MDMDQQVEQQREFKFGNKYSCCFVLNPRKKEEPEVNIVDCVKAGVVGSLDRSLTLKLERKEKVVVKLIFTHLQGGKGARRTFTFDGMRTSQACVTTHFGDGLEVSITLNCHWVTVVSRAQHQFQGTKYDLHIPVVERGDQVLERLGWNSYFYELLIMPCALIVPASELLAVFGDALRGDDNWLSAREKRH